MSLLVDDNRRAMAAYLPSGLRAAAKWRLPQFGMQRRISVLAATVLLLMASSPAAAATVIYYSDPGETYGWAAGYGYDQAHSDAAEQCAAAGGTDCQPVAECDGGWSAVAYAKVGVNGFGAACGFNTAFSARTLALMNCVAAANAICWTASTFNTNGRELSDEDDLEFDRTWYAQLLLVYLRRYDLGDPDGEMGPKTRAAVRAFQTAIGDEPSGVIDDETISRLLDAIGGEQTLASGIRRNMTEQGFTGSSLENHMYGFSSVPAPAQTFTQDLMGRTEDERLLALAINLAAGGTPCTLPARSAEPVPGAQSETWRIECDEGSFTLILEAGGSRLVIPGEVEIEVVEKDGGIFD